MFELQPLELAAPTAHALASFLWNNACGQEMALSANTVAQLVDAPDGVQQVGQIAFVEGAPAGFVLASFLRDQPDVVSPTFGWLDALAVIPKYRQRGVGQTLLEWGETWLRAQKCTHARLGGSMRPFAPGAPDELKSADFFCARGYAARAENPRVWDLGRDLRDYQSPTFAQNANPILRPALSEDVDALREFLKREFPGRWSFEFEQFLKDGGRISDYLILKNKSSAREIDACCAMTLEDSARPVERFYPQPLPRPWAHVGSIGVSADRRSAGYGSALLDAALKYLRERQVRGCIIDWTHLVAYYERFGFKPHRSYLVLVKEFDKL